MCACVGVCVGGVGGCVSVDLFIHHAKRMRRIILPTVAYPVLLYFSTLSHEWHDFRKKVIGSKIFILIFSTTFFRDFSHF